jgi:hypothetical protein
VKSRNKLQDVLDHLARYPGGRTERYARAKLDDLVWARLGAAPTIEQLRGYLDEFPTGENAEAARKQIMVLDKEAAELDAWDSVAKSKDTDRIASFLLRWPEGRYAAAAKARIGELRRSMLTKVLAVLLELFGMTLSVAFLGVIILSVYGGWIHVGYPWIRTQAIYWNVNPTALEAKEEQKLVPGSLFKECANCPDMVVVPAGEYEIGSNDNEATHPEHFVVIQQPFAAGKYAVTSDEWGGVLCPWCVPLPGRRK